MRAFFRIVSAMGFLWVVVGMAQGASAQDPNCGAACNSSNYEFGSGDSCDDCGLESSEEYCDWFCLPTWEGSVGALFLTRSRPDGGIMVGNNPFTGTSFSRGSDFNFNTGAGFDVNIARRFGNGDQLEGRYFGIDEISAVHQFNAPGNFIGAGFTGPGGTLFRGTNTTKISSAELNWRRPLTERFTVLAGFRYLGFNDSVDYTLNTTVARGLYQFQNRLYGGQIGTDLSLIEAGRPFQLHVIGKVGVYGNDVDGRLREFQGVNPIGTFGRDDTGTSFLGDLQIVGSYKLTSHIALRGGYQMLWLENLALAGDNASLSLQNPSLLNTTTDQNGSAFLHGAMAGVEVTW